MIEKKKRQKDYSRFITQTLASYDVWLARPGEYRACCPFHAGADNNTSFRIFASGRYKCFKCGAEGWMDRLLAHVKHVPLANARAALEAANLPLLAAQGPRQAQELWMTEAGVAAYGRNCPNYLLARGFSPQALRRFEIGYDTQQCKIIMPLRDHEKKLVGLTYRIDYEDYTSQPAKYWHDNFAKSEHLYGFHLHKAADDLVLVEGQLDAVRCSQLGMAAVALMGSDLSKTQLELITRHSKARRIHLAFDNDEAGAKVTRQAAGLLLKTRFARSLYILKYPGPDPGELETLRGTETQRWFTQLLAPDTNRSYFKSFLARQARPHSAHGPNRT